MAETTYSYLISTEVIIVVKKYEENKCILEIRCRDF